MGKCKALQTAVQYHTMDAVTQPNISWPHFLHMLINENVELEDVRCPINERGLDYQDSTVHFRS